MTCTNNFTKEDITRLFYTYKNKQSNYNKIKQKLTATSNIEKLNKSRRTYILFFCAFSFIIIVSSAFSFFGDQMNTFYALLIIWLIGTTIFSAFLFFLWKGQIKTHKINIDFFERFEAYAEKNELVFDFLN